MVCNLLVAPGMGTRTPLLTVLFLLSLSPALAEPGGPAERRDPQFRERLRSRVERAADINFALHKAMAQQTPRTFGPVSDMIFRTHHEPELGLHKMGTMSLLKQKMPLLRWQKKAILQMIRSPERGLLPKNPPLPATGTIEARHYAMRDFLEPDIQQFEQAGFKVEREGRTAVATRGRLRVVMRETHEDILRDIVDPNVHVITYNGHSQIGGTVEQALQRLGDKEAVNRKLLAMFQCVGTQTLPLVKARVPSIDVITSRKPLYVRETPSLVRALYEGIEKGEGYHRLYRRLEDAAWYRGRLVFPHRTDSLEHTDYDINGVLDSQQAGKIEALSEKQQQTAKSVMSGVHYLRTMNPYYAEETPGAVFDKRDAEIPLVAMGISFHGPGTRVARVREMTDQGKRRFEIALDAKFKDADPHFVAAATVFELQMHLQKTLAGKSDPRAKVRALAFTGEYLQLIESDRRAAQRALDGVTEMYDLPRLSLFQVEMALAGEHVIGEKQVDRLEELVNRAAGDATP